MKQVSLVGILAVDCVGWSNGAGAQTAISADGVVESTSGGFKFPDGSVQTAAVAGSAPVEDTGQTECWDTDGVALPSCDGTGMDGELRRGVAWPTPRFVDNGNGTVSDNLTGLTWLRDGTCLGQQDWAEALAEVAALNAGTVDSCAYYTAGTHADWRLPNIKELLSLIDYGRTNPAIAPDNHFENISSEIYWTSTTSLEDTEYAWVVHLGHGDGYNEGNDGYKPFDARVLPVRGGQ